MHLRNLDNLPSSAFFQYMLTLLATFYIFRSLSFDLKIAPSLSAFLIILCISERVSSFSVHNVHTAWDSYLPSILFSSMSHSLGKCPPRGLRRARYILLPLAHDRGAPSSYANLLQISHGISLEIHNRCPPRAPPPPLSRRPPEARGKKPMIRKK